MRPLVKILRPLVVIVVVFFVIIIKLLFIDNVVAEKII